MAKKKEVPVEAVKQEAMHQTDGVQVDNELVPVKSSEKKASIQSGSQDREGNGERNPQEKQSGK